RIHRYFEADLVVSTDGVAPEVIARRLNDRLASSGMERIPIEVPGSPHEASVGARLRPMIVSTLIRLGISGTVVVVSDRVVAEAHGAVLMDELTSAGIDAKLHLVPVGEAAKAMDTLAEIYEALAAASVDRAGALIALGGGAVGDVADSPPRPGCAASGTSRFPPRYWRWWIAASAARPRSICRPGKTWLVRSISHRPYSATSTTSPDFRMTNTGPHSRRSSRRGLSPTAPSSIGYPPTWRHCWVGSRPFCAR